MRGLTCSARFAATLAAAGAGAPRNARCVHVVTDRSGNAFQQASC
jgi:hypothetical protein